MKKFFRNQSEPSARRINLDRGFTLIEILVVMAVTVLLSAMTIFYNRTTRQQVSLYAEEAKIIQLISRSKSLAISTYQNAPALCGYGFHIDYNSRAYSLFRYPKLTGVDCQSLASLNVGLEQAIQNFSLDPNLVFRDGSAKMTDVLFIPPDPKTLITSGSQSIPGGTGNIFLGTKDGSASITISVSSAGQITF